MRMWGGTPKFDLQYKYIIGMADVYTQHIAVCPDCGFIYTMNPFSQKLLDNRYANYSKFEFDEENYFLGDSEEYIKRSKRQKEFIERYGGTFSSVLEIGAASGYNLGLYVGKKRLGIEPSFNNCKSAKERYDVPMFCGTFNEYMESGRKEKWDLIFLSHTLEHIINPFDFIKKCEKINNEFIFIEVPTFDYKFNNEAYGMFCEEHVNYFTLEALQNLMNRAGYELVNVHMLFEMEIKLPAGWPAIETLWKKKQPVRKYEMVNSSEYILSKYIECSKKELIRIKGIIDRIDVNAKLAIWGTGHHVSMLLANTNLEQKNIVKYYDSDKKKHNLKMGDKGIWGFNPKDIDEGTVDTILVATYTAQEAITRALEPYREKCRIVLLY